MSERPSLLVEFVDFLRNNLLWWLLPLVIVLAVLALVAWAARSTGSPFVYTLF